MDLSQGSGCQFKTQSADIKFVAKPDACWGVSSSRLKADKRPARGNQGALCVSIHLSTRPNAIFTSRREIDLLNG